MANCISVQCKIYAIISSQIIIISFYWNGSYWLSTVMGIHNLLGGKIQFWKSLSLFQHQIMSGSELPTSTFFPGSFFALSPQSHFQITCTFNLGCGETIRKQFAICFFHEIWKKPLQEKRGIRIEVLFRVCSYLVSTELRRWGAELLDLRTFPWETVLALGSWYLGINRSRQGMDRGLLERFVNKSLCDSQ